MGEEAAFVEARVALVVWSAVVVKEKEEEEKVLLRSKIAQGLAQATRLRASWREKRRMLPLPGSECGAALPSHTHRLVTLLLPIIRER